jgi:hypothetical protein
VDKGQLNSQYHFVGRSVEVVHGNWQLPWMTERRRAGWGGQSVGRGRGVGTAAAAVQLVAAREDTKSGRGEGGGCQAQATLSLLLQKSVE